MKAIRAAMASGIKAWTCRAGTPSASTATVIASRRRTPLRQISAVLARQIPSPCSAAAGTPRPFISPAVTIWCKNTERHFNMNHSKTLLWLPSLTALGSLLACYLLELNEALFYAINSTSLYLGNLWVNLTILGDGLIAALFMIPFLRKQPRTVWAMVWAALVFNVILHILKSGLDVPRPPFVLPTETFHLIGPEYHHRSFPSGHTATAAAVAGVIAFGLKNWWGRLGLLVAALLIGLSRIGVGVHWPADVLAGLALGWLSAW
ncbi:phosphatase PAP2 family protein, partial [candidate division KSB1 bacterium]